MSAKRIETIEIIDLLSDDKGGLGDGEMLEDFPLTYEQPYLSNGVSPPEFVAEVAKTSATDDATIFSSYVQNSYTELLER